MEQYLEPLIITSNVFLFVPNVIGYARIISLLLSCLFMSTLPSPTFMFYLISAGLDAFDGIAARKYRQETRFGQLLDQLTDRCSTLCLVMALGYFYPSFLFFFQLVAIIDIAGHWIHTQVYIMTGNASHKIIEARGKKNDDWHDKLVKLLQIYYGNRIVLFGLCLANEVFYVSLYMLYFYEGFEVIGSIGFWRLFTILTFPCAIAKLLSTLMQLYAACLLCADMDVKNRLKSK